MKHRHLKSIGIALVLCLSLLSGCAKPVQMADKDENVILCTTFAAYDWVREILGDTDTFTCRMLVDNGVDLHSYQPSAQDIMKIANCRMLVYVGGESDTWVSDALVESGNENIVAISLLDLVGNRALNEVELEGVEEHHHHDHDDEDHDHEAEPADHAEGEADNTDGQNAAEDDHYDEHVWLSLKNAIVCTETLADAITELDSDNAKQYVTNAKTYTGIRAVLQMWRQVCIQLPIWRRSCRSTSCKPSMWWTMVPTASRIRLRNPQRCNPKFCICRPCSP